MAEMLYNTNGNMDIEYRGHELQVNREPSITGQKLLFWSIFRDGYEVDSGYSYSNESKEEYIDGLKDRVDAELNEAKVQ